MSSLIPQDFPDWSPLRQHVGDPVFIYNAVPGTGGVVTPYVDLKDATEVVLYGYSPTADAIFFVAWAFRTLVASDNVVFSEHMYVRGGKEAVVVRIPVMARYGRFFIVERTSTGATIELAVVPVIGAGLAGLYRVRDFFPAMVTVAAGSSYSLETADYVRGMCRILVNTTSPIWTVSLDRASGSNVWETLWSATHRTARMPLDVQMFLRTAYYRVTVTNTWNYSATFFIQISQQTP